MESRKTVLYLCRHGEVADQYLPTSYGHLNVPLSERGIAQSRTLGRTLSAFPLDAVYCSDLDRAVFAAELVAAECELAPILQPSLREIGMGDWEGRKVADLNAEFRELVASFFADPVGFQFPSGESFSEFTDRVDQALAQILSSHYGHVAIIAHAGVCRAIIGRALGIPAANWLRLTQDFGCVNILEWYNGYPAVKLINYVPHEEPSPAIRGLDGALENIIRETEGD